ncbi:GNAT family N-acetyltransferase [Brevibacterium luteolum]|uniref:N-acetyltransferase family protein n=1 Tax=Brevibacterium luteolum TaxID=199591 RepID=UPI00387A6739
MSMTADEYTNGDRAPRVRVREVAEADEPQWRQLFAAYRDFYRLTPDESVVDRVWAWLNDEGHELRGLVALTDSAESAGRRGESIVGIGHFRRFARPSTGSVGLWLDDLFTAPEARGLGAGSALIDQIRAEARAQSCSVVRWITAADNSTARSLYDQLAVQTNWVTYDAQP